MKRKKILFTPTDKAVDSVLSIPKPSANHVPEWYKNQKLFSNVTNNFIDAYKLPDFFGTYKACVPFVDTLTSGYTITLDSDVIFTNGTNRGYLPKPSWMGPIPPLDNPDNNKIRSIYGICIYIYRMTLNNKDKLYIYNMYENAARNAMKNFKQ